MYNHFHCGESRFLCNNVIILRMLNVQTHSNWDWAINEKKERKTKERKQQEND